MAVLIYKDNECIRVEPESLRRHLDAGWSVEEPAALKPKAPDTFYPHGFDLAMPQAEAEDRVLKMMKVIVPDPVVIRTGEEICKANNIKVLFPVSTPPKAVKAPAAKKTRKPRKKAA